jgi:hypothetical protein
MFNYILCFCLHTVKHLAALSQCTSDTQSIHIFGLVCYLSTAWICSYDVYNVLFCSKVMFTMFCSKVMFTMFCSKAIFTMFCSKVMFTMLCSKAMFTMFCSKAMYTNGQISLCSYTI